MPLALALMFLTPIPENKDKCVRTRPFLPFTAFYSTLLSFRQSPFLPAHIADRSIPCTPPGASVTRPVGRFQACSGFRIPRVCNDPFVAKGFCRPCGCAIENSAGVSCPVRTASVHFQRQAIIHVSADWPAHHAHTAQSPVVIAGNGKLMPGRWLVMPMVFSHEFFCGRIVAWPDFKAHSPCSNSSSILIWLLSATLLQLATACLK